MIEKNLIVSEHMACITNPVEAKNAFSIPLKKVPSELDMMVKVYNNDFFVYTMDDIIRYVINNDLTDEATINMLKKSLKVRNTC